MSNKVNGDLDHAFADSSLERLVVDNLSKTFRRRVGRNTEENAVLEDISFSVEPGKFLTIVGPSGCGKSTLLNCIAGLTSYNSGEIRYGSELIDGPGPNRAVVFQHASLLPWRSIHRNVAYGLELRRTLTKQQIAERTEAALEMVGLASFANHFPHEISGGMQQRANLARALVLEPEILLMDEPFGALDALTKETLQDEMISLTTERPRTTLFVTHDIQEAVYLADKVLVMSARPGQIAAEIAVPFSYPRERSIVSLPEFAQIEEQLRSLVGATHGTEAASVAN